MSARLDGETAELSDDLVDAHLAACEDCQRWYSTVTALGRRMNVSATPTEGEPATEPGDEQKAALLAQVLEQADRNPQISGGLRRRQLPLLFGRSALVIVALVYVVWGLSMLFGSPLGDDADSSQLRLVSDAATMRFALAGGLLWAAWRPKAALSLIHI